VYSQNQNVINIGYALIPCIRKKMAYMNKWLRNQLLVYSIKFLCLKVWEGLQFASFSIWFQNLGKRGESSVMQGLRKLPRQVNECCFKISLQQLDIRLSLCSMVVYLILYINSVSLSVYPGQYILNPCEQGVIFMSNVPSWMCLYVCLCGQKLGSAWKILPVTARSLWSIWTREYIVSFSSLLIISTKTKIGTNTWYQNLMQMSNLNYVWGGLNMWMLIYNYIREKWENLIFPYIIYPPNNILLTHIVSNFNIKYFL